MLHKKMLPIISTFVLLIANLLPLRAQNSENYGSGLKVTFGDKGDKYVRFLIWNQIWARYNDNNPDTYINNERANSTMDMGARRLRLLAYAQITPRYLILTHFGINNQTFINGGGSGSGGTGGYGQGKKPQLFFHDAYNEYAIIPAKNAAGSNKFSLSLGAGLHYWNGVSRLSSASTLNFLMIDAPIFNWPLIENADQFARQYGIYIKGTCKKFHYQWSVDKPFATDSESDTQVSNIAVDNSGNPSTATGGYVEYQFFSEESNLLPYRVGTYLGAKKVFNVGAGYYHQPRGTQSLNAAGNIQKHNISLFSGDVFLDLPVGPAEKNMAVTAYGVFYNFDFGPNYLRKAGIMNTGTLVKTPASVPEGPGNSRVLLGTGSIAYIQAGFLLPKFKNNNKVRLQPMAALAYKKMEALKAAGSFWDLGCNIYLDAHNAKITAQYSSRPLYDGGTRELKDRRGEFIIQFQIAI